MFGPCQYWMLIEAMSLLLRLLVIMAASGKVTVLVLMIAAPGAVRADDANGIDLRLFEFTSEFYMLMGRGRFDGLMACDGSHYRIAIYWIEPPLFRDRAFFLGYSDFIFSEEVAHYWIYGVSQPGTFGLSDNSVDPLLPRDVSVESVARSALAILNRIRSQPQNENTPMEVGKFFHESRGQTDYSYEVPSGQTSSDQSSGSRASDVQIMNALPYGRKYSKETRSDGALVWRAQRVLDGPHVVSVTVKPVSGMETDDGNMFDPDTLGQWTLIPEPYRAYWSFDRAYSELKDAPDDGVPSRELNDKIESYLDKNKVPSNVCLALNQLRFKTALMTGDMSRVSRAAQAVVAKLCDDVSVSNYRGLLELARIAAQIREQYPQQADELVRPLVGQMVKYAGPNAPRSLERLMTTIENNKWFWYGKLLVEEARSQALVEEDIAETLGARLEAARLARELPPSDPCEWSASVEQYLAQLDADPPRSTITMDDVSEILEKGLAKHYTDDEAKPKRELVENVIRSIRLIVGEGPFRGDQAKLIESIKRFSWLYLVVDRTREPMDMVLATFLALSFCDISTAEDHDVLFSQIRKLCGEFQSLTNSMLTERGLSELVTPSDVERLFGRYEQIFRRYIDDPLWPAFKFPLTANEETRLISKLKLRFTQLEPLFEEMSLKVRYGGVSDELKEKTVREISRAAQQLLPETAFLRNPPYPGVSCQYRGKYGFTVVIRGQLYKEGERPNEKFKAMKYFHMGHRLEDIVKRERELAGAH